MRGLRHIATLGPTPIRAHWSTLLVPLVTLAFALYSGLSWRGVLWLEGFVLAVVACVLLHELGHALAARYFGVRVHDILLLPIGGAARLERVPAHPWDEVAVAFAGPLANLLIALLLAPALYLLPRAAWVPWSGDFTWGSALASLALFNFAAFVLNLLPAFPLDGGRMLRAALTDRIDRLRATRLVAFVARVGALLLLGYAVYDASPYLGVFAAFLFFSSGREIRVTRVQTFLDETTLGAVALPTWVHEPSTSIAEVADHLRRTGQHGAVIADECCPIGFVTGAMLAAAPDPAVHVGDLEMAPVVCHDADAPLRRLSHQFSAHPRSVAIEEVDGRPVGVLDLEQLDEVFQEWCKGG